MTARRGRRSRREWIARAALAVGFLILGLIAARHSLGFALRGADIARARALSPGDARLQALQAQSLAQPEASPADRLRAAQLARRALARDPMTVAAVDALAAVALLRRENEKGGALFGYATRLSRRDLPSQLWSIEDAVARGDIVEALSHYDVALRASAPAADLLLPVLSAATSDAAIRTALRDRLLRRPSWSEAFFSYAADKGPDYPAVATLFAQLQRRRVAPPGYVRAALISRLIERGAYEPAWRYYASTMPGVDRQTLRDPRFTAAPADPTAFDWAMVNDAGVTAAIQGDGASALLALSAAPGAGGPLARQLQVLLPGRYVLAGRSADIDQPAATTPYWSLVCVDGREAGAVTVRASRLDGGRFAGTLVVPASCPAQWLTLIARPSDAVQGLQGAIRTVALRPARQDREKAINDSDLSIP